MGITQVQGQLITGLSGAVAGAVDFQSFNIAVGYTYDHIVNQSPG
jgi:hypothetical protein